MNSIMKNGNKKIVQNINDSPHLAVRSKLKLSIKRWLEIILRIEADRRIELLVN